MAKYRLTKRYVDELGYAYKPQLLEMLSPDDGTVTSQCGQRMAVFSIQKMLEAGYDGIEEVEEDGIKCSHCFKDLGIEQAAYAINRKSLCFECFNKGAVALREDKPKKEECDENGCDKCSGMTPLVEPKQKEIERPKELGKMVLIPPSATGGYTKKSRRLNAMMRLLNEISNRLNSDAGYDE